MISKDIRDVYLVDELQLGQRLNESLHEGDQTDFNLMLAMLSPDVCDASWTRGPDIAQAPEDLRTKFCLLPEIRKYAESDDFSRGQDFADMIHDHEDTQVGQSQVFLAECLRQEPLVPFKRDLAPEVYAELAPLKKEKVRRQFAGEIIQYETYQGSGQNMDVLSEIKHAQTQIQTRMKIDATA
ncbi:MULTISPECIES: VC2046/SO_2500 family protein [unclassified Anaerobiospirillum]|uniref:VC2046/SO_2500 family protein n=1 Tax=unclassified Anaerobiospirillum TaxID=2647410 RepID=UPI001FF32B51|nr:MULTISPECIES: VC2046/SO_2500 family protein [unclassified Anaerobiospirillum]MCK0535683.1 hypothetical protein [Anaerobiospirillum sp. NML120511]MCK0540867.1 hypothetical protein [Anaerobiospirillum sp. NML02-A-032]